MMDIQTVEIPSPGSLPLSFSQVSRRGHHTSIYRPTRRGFGVSKSNAYLVYALKNPFKEQFESQTLERLEKPLDPEEEKKQLIVESPAPPDAVSETSPREGLKRPLAEEEEQEESSNDLVAKKKKLF